MAGGVAATPTIYRHVHKNTALDMIAFFGIGVTPVASRQLAGNKQQGTQDAVTIVITCISAETKEFM